MPPKPNKNYVFSLGALPLFVLKKGKVYIVAMPAFSMAIDIHRLGEAYERKLKSLRSDRSLLARNKQLILKFLADCELGKTIKGRAKKKIGPSRLLKYSSVLKTLSGWLDKAFDQANQADIERIVGNLEKDVYQTKRGQPFAAETKVDFKKALKKFYKWLLGDNRRYPEMVEWIDTFSEMKEIPALTREEIERLATHCPVRNRALIMVLFDSGARASELLSIKIGDLTRKDDYYMMRIRKEYSKTKGRTISLAMCTEPLDAWLQAYPESNNPEARLFPLTYNALRMLLSRLGKEVLNKKVTPHILRHSSATYYCHKLNQYQLCYRYGWSMASSQPQRYIDREGISEEGTAELVKSDEMGALKKANQQLQESLSLLKEQQDKVVATLKKREAVDPILDLLFRNKRIAKMIRSQLAQAGIVQPELPKARAPKPR